MACSGPNSSVLDATPALAKQGTHPQSDIRILLYSPTGILASQMDRGVFVGKNQMFGVVRLVKGELAPRVAAYSVRPEVPNLDRRR